MLNIERVINDDKSIGRNDMEDLLQELKTSEALDDASEETVTTEAFKNGYWPVIYEHLALEARYQEESSERLGIATEDAWDTTKNIASAVGQGAAATGSFAYRNLIKDNNGEDKILTKLAKLGYDYGSTGFKHFAKGLLTILRNSLKSLQRNTLILSRIVLLRKKTYQDFMKRITTARQIIELLQKSGTQVDPTKDVYMDRMVIAMLKIGSDVSFLDHINKLIHLNTAYSHQIVGRVGHAVTNLTMLMKSIMEGKLELPDLRHTEPKPNNGFSLLKEEEYIAEYVYTDTLPGDRILIIDVPLLTNNYDNDKTAYTICRSHVEINPRSIAQQPKAVRFLSLKEISSYLDTMEKLCLIGLEFEKQFKELSRYRSSLSVPMSAYVDYLTSIDRRITIKQSFAEIVNMKMHYIDSVLIGGQLSIHDMNIDTLTAAMTYVKASLDQYKE